jgi:hypothetical protein
MIAHLKPNDGECSRATDARNPPVSLALLICASPEVRVPLPETPGQFGLTMPFGVRHSFKAEYHTKSDK